MAAYLLSSPAIAGFGASRRYAIAENIRARSTKALDVTLLALLQSTSFALAAIGLLFLLKGAAHELAPARSRVEADAANAGQELARGRALRRADWSCAAVLLGIALIAFVAGRAGSGPLFTEPSGNRAGGIVLMAIIVFVVLLVALIVREIVLSRALRRLERRPR